MLVDALNLMQACVDMSGSYESRKVDRSELDNGIIVSTAYTTDMGYETALILTDGEVCPVERYGSKNDIDLQSNHDKWVRFAEDNYGKEFTVLGYGSCIDDYKSILK